MKTFLMKNPLLRNFHSGFTLIELLVVVAIISVISAVIFAALGSARAKGGDAAIKTNLSTVRSMSELFYLSNGSFLPSGGSTFAIAACPVYSASGTNMLSKDSVIASAVAEAVKRGNSSSCYNSAIAWAVAVGFKSDSNVSWCIDNTPTSKQVNSAPATAINGTTFTCN
jgi:prepilin-type N-terminal cleavage/methylation domain-containing protein